MKKKIAEGIEIEFKGDKRPSIDPEKLYEDLKNFTPAQSRAVLALLDEADRKEPLSEDSMREFLTGEGSLAHAMGVTRDEIESYIALGYRLLEVGKINDAKRAYTFVAQVYPIDPRPYVALGSIALEADELDQAEAFFSAAIECFGGDLGAHAGRAVARIHQGKTENVAEDVQKALEYDPEGDIGLTAIMAGLLTGRQ